MCVCLFILFMSLCVYVFVLIYFINVFIFNLTCVQLDIIMFIIYFILILVLLIFLKKWVFKIQKILKKTIQGQNMKSDKKEKWTKIKQNYNMTDYRRSPPKVFLVKGVLKIWSKFTGEHPYGSLISIKLQSMGVLL